MSMPSWWPALGLALWAATLAALRLCGPLDEYALAGRHGYRGHVPWDTSIQTMLDLHASVNALGFVGLGLWGWQALGRARAR